ncbi:MAG TPA: hypothetical protein PLZ67_06585 [Bacteroidales bacterium]|nr:hypothetical protein [Bacteroidales bacterium]
MKIFFFAIFALSACISFAQNSTPDFPALSDIEKWDQYSGVKSTSYNGDSIVPTWQNGMLNGDYKSFYSNGQLKAKGQFRNNFRTGKWTFYSEDGKGKVIIDFTEHGNVMLHRARIPGKGGVRFGRGKITNSIPDFDIFHSDTVQNFISGTVPFRGGLKHGTEIIKYSNGTIKSETQFRFGLYDGLRKIYFSNGQLNFQCEYRDGAPIGQRKEYSPDGALVSARVMDMSGNGQASFHLDQFDVFMSARKFVYADTLFDETALFFKPDSALPLFGVLNSAFEKGNLSAYADDELKEIYFPMHDKPDLSGLQKEDGDYKNLRGFVYKIDEVFNTQTWLMYKYPLAIQPVSSVSANDSLTFHGGPWLYFPQLRSEIPASDYHFSFFKSFGYPFMTAMQLGMIPRQIDFSDPDAIALEQLRSVELEHELWLLFYGLEKNWKKW